MQPRADDGQLLDSEAQGAVIPFEPQPLAGDARYRAGHDRWHWRRRIRANRHQHFVYRIVIGLLGLLCIGAGVITGPLPGPGGIPLVLLGMAIWASEFGWARRLMLWFKALLHRVRMLTPGKKAMFWICFLACCGLIGYTSLLMFGLPGWLPGWLDHVLTTLPGVS